MRSIRRSLIVYFLVLLAGALGGVSWLVYDTSASTLREKQTSTQDLIQSQYRSDCQQVRDVLDQRILHQAQAIASLARFGKPNYEPLNALGALSTPLNPHGLWTLDLWLAEGLHPPLVWHLFGMRPMNIVFESFEGLIPTADTKQAQEYFQAYRKNGKPVQRSEDMEGFSFTLSLEMHDNLQVLAHQFDDVEPMPGLKVRRVTIKAPVLRHLSATSPNWRFLYQNIKGQPRPSFRGPPAGGADFFAPVIFIQYASDTRPMERRFVELAEQRDDKLASLDEESRAVLASLRNHLFGICVAAFVAAMLGGCFLIGFGLSPLARLSDAVSQVSEKDFRLKIDQQDLPRELKPIATRLAATLQQLQAAFDREKQAAADISHELRTPLAAIMTTLEVALKRSRTAAEYRELLEECRSSGQHMTVLVERLLALARLDAGAVPLKNESVDAASLARQCAGLVKPLADARGLALRVHADEPVPLEGDPDKIREILNNLLHNAIQYNRPNGSIDVDVCRENGHVMVEVRDTGIGISAEARQHIFERFYRADPSRHSEDAHAGLGLAIVKSYLDLMGGVIGVESGGQGTTFRVQLPAG